jgi:deoxyribodipyrimidine photolyase
MENTQMAAGCTENPPAEPARTGLMWFRRDLRAEDGRTGYPLVDAAMAQINQTG